MVARLPKCSEHLLVCKLAIPRPVSIGQVSGASRLSLRPWRLGNILRGVRRQVRWRAQRSHPPCLCILNAHRLSFLVFSLIRRIERQLFFCALPKPPRG